MGALFRGMTCYFGVFRTVELPCACALESLYDLGTCSAWVAGRAVWGWCLPAVQELKETHKIRVVEERSGDGSYSKAVASFLSGW